MLAKAGRHVSQLLDTRPTHGIRAAPAFLERSPHRIFAASVNPFSPAGYAGSLDR